MNGNRGQYTSAPLYNMKNKRPAPQQGNGDGQNPQQPSPKRKGGGRFKVLAAVLSLGLPVLFLLSLLIPSNVLKIVFLVLTALSVAAMWVLGAFVRNARSTLTIVYGALAVVIGLALFMNGPGPETQSASKTMADQGALFGSNVDQSALNAMLQSTQAVQPTETPAAATVSAAQERLELFLQYWAENNIPSMLELCAPSWVSQQDAPQEKLWQLILNRRPLQYQIESVQGSEADSSRTITLKVLIAREGFSQAEMNRMQVLLFRVNDVWYVDPQSLGGTVIDEAAEQAKQAENDAYVGTTIAPTATPAPSDANAVILYYNKDGGKYYHAMANCPDVDQRYWPLDEFYYSDLNTTKFKNLLRCEKCNAPARPTN